ncbi:MAG TPA: hypothetical protein VM032_02875 [Vicinamibacterales bacterium]|nr:hypothetical protein [Vicinamibacterales bacterium]
MQTASAVLWRAAGRVAFGVAALALLPYVWGPIYRFPEPRPFSGSQLRNPYATSSGQWQRANFHAHGRAWGGLTSGAQPNQVVADRYRGLGYSVAGISNYMSIASFHGVDTVPLYEHGFNVGKNHQLAIGAHGVDWFDFPLWQTLSNQQYVIDRVHRKADLVSLNHPSSRDAYDLRAMGALTGYDLIEVVNGPFVAEDVWDAALSAGRAVWAVANDDTHDVNDARRTGAGWNMIDAATASTANVVAALREGRFYAVLRTGAVEGAGVTTLQAVSVAGTTLRVNLNGAASTIIFIGQDGAPRATYKDTLSAEYAFAAADTYVRTIVVSPQTTLFLNPVTRWDGSALPTPSASVDGVWTWTQRGGALLACVALWLRVRSKRAAAPLAVPDVAARRA